MIWSVVLCVGLVLSDPVHVGLGFLGVIAVGFVLYFSIPASRRVTVDHFAED